MRRISCTVMLATEHWLCYIEHGIVYCSIDFNTFTGCTRKLSNVYCLLCMSQLDECLSLKILHLTTRLLFVVVVGVSFICKHCFSVCL